MKVNRVDHICIAVKNLEEAKKVWEPIMGKDKPDDEYIDEPEKINVARYYLGEVGFELMESTTPDGDVAKFIIGLDPESLKCFCCKMYFFVFIKTPMKMQ